ncbi:hypothetical protein FLAV_01149 [Flavobacteriales bacterium]|nr:hypothetical protein [Flavobacteriales bacterium]MCL4816652.1 hypothetical protein [Flavobacteriales bacterium]WKZ75804.1 MAG: hypothetical protein QY303_02685 [Vicingaceae bacterium]GIK70058.1 MAG: hypothetical protein BroJett020_13530 [Bacteroidota bacterium]CAG0969568.1 hypothetical protein FLAV_01149 [Flavobacteriales bacterium]
MKKLLFALALTGFVAAATIETYASTPTSVECDGDKKCDKKDCKKKCDKKDASKACCKKEGDAKKACCKKEGDAKKCSSEKTDANTATPAGTEVAPGTKKACSHEGPHEH